MKKLLALLLILAFVAVTVPAYAQNTRTYFEGETGSSDDGSTLRSVSITTGRSEERRVGKECRL